MRELSIRSFRLDQTPAVIVCEVADATNGQPIPDALAGLLRPSLAGRAPDAPAFPPMPRLRTAAMIRADLAAAGIPYQDGTGRVADFHALLASDITAIVRGGRPSRRRRCWRDTRRRS